MKQIDNRYLRIKMLGSGGQGKVYLCMDPKLQRKVAVKLLSATAASVDGTEGQLREARLAAGINHPNIVSVFDAGQHGEQSYVVFEYVAGRTLATLLQAGQMSVPRALDILAGILAGLAQAHGEGLVHRDLKPTNIVIGADDTPKIMDFGIAGRRAENCPADRAGSGTLGYLAPERIRDGSADACSDVFAVGVMAYEMLTGETAYPGTDRARVLARVLETDLPPVSKRNAEIGEALDQWVLRATDRDPSRRYPTAAEMLDALDTARDTGGDPVDGTGLDRQATIEFLMRRMQHQPEFPALARSVSRINQLVFTDERDIEALAKIIVNDFGLTSRILKVVNSAHYGPFAGKIGTISRAIIVLGTGVVRSIAATLSLLENLGDAGRRDSVRDELSAAVFSGVLARELMAGIDPDRREDALLAAMLHNLGRLLVAFYLPDEWREVHRLVEQQGVQPEQAETRVLGVGFDRIGCAAAERWNFPRPIVTAMKAVDGRDTAAPRTSDERLRLVAHCANEVTQLLIADGDDKVCARIADRFGSQLGFDAQHLDELLVNCEREFMTFQTEVMQRRDKSNFLTRLRGDRGANAQRDSGAETEPDCAGEVGDLPPTAVIDVDMGLVQEDAEQLLSQTIQEATNLLVGDYTLPELFSVVLEGMYRSARFDRIVLCLLDPRSGHVAGKIGYGEHAEALAQGFRFDFVNGQSVFDVTLQKGADVYIEDTGKAGIDRYLPEWYRTLTRARSFLAMPIVAQRRPLGLIYGEFDHSHGFAAGERLLNPLKSLRNQLVLGIKAKM